MAPLLIRAQNHSSSSRTARGVVARIQEKVGVPWRTPTADEFKIGDPDAPITGITTTCVSTLDLLHRSIAAGNTCVITPAPESWRAADVVSAVRSDPLYTYNVNFVGK